MERRKSIKEEEKKDKDNQNDGEDREKLIIEKIRLEKLEEDMNKLLREKKEIERIERYRLEKNHSLLREKFEREQKLQREEEMIQREKEEKLQREIEEKLQRERDEKLQREKEEINTGLWKEWLLRTGEKYSRAEEPKAVTN